MPIPNYCNKDNFKLKRNIESQNSEMHTESCGQEAVTAFNLF